MPKTVSKSFKKKKYNARFPPARIKKIMQTDEEVGKVAAAVPVIISRALEMFIESLITETAKFTQSKNAKTLSTSHIKQTIKATSQFDFLCDLVKNVPDHQTEDNNGDSSYNDGESSTKRGKGRPRKTEAASYGGKKKAGGSKTSSDEEYDDDEETEATETDEECEKLESGTKAVCSNQTHNLLQPSFSAMSHNNNYVPTAAGSVSNIPIEGDSLISGKNMAQELHFQSLPLSSSSDPQPQLQQPLFQTPSNFTTPSFPPYMPSKGSLHNMTSVSSASPANPIPHMQQQPIDLRNPLQQNCVNEDDDYDT